MNDISAESSASALLREVRVKILQLHKTLLEMERKRYEKTHERVKSGELLQLVINHPEFAWLRMVSALVVQIDETLDADEPTAEPDVINLITGARQVFTESADQEFQQNYQAALQQDPEVVMAHSALMKLLR